jgi:hypothetical protein
VLGIPESPQGTKARADFAGLVAEQLTQPPVGGAPGAPTGVDPAGFAAGRAAGPKAGIRTGAGGAQRVGPGSAPDAAGLAAARAACPALLAGPAAWLAGGLRGHARGLPAADPGTSRIRPKRPDKRYVQRLPRLAFIRASQAIRLRVAEIREVIGIRDRGTPPCAHVLDLIERHRAEVRARIRQLQQFEQDLALPISRMNLGARSVEAPSRCF